MRIGILFKSLDSGGAENRTLELIEKLNEQRPDFKFLIFIYAEENGALFDRFKSLNNTRIINIRNKKLVENIKVIKSLDIFISNLYLFSGIVMVALKILRVRKRVSYIRTYIDTPDKFKKFQYKILKKLVENFSTEIVCVSEAVKESMDFREDNVSVLYNGIKTNKIEDNIYNTKKNHYKVKPEKLIHIGRFSKAKNHEFIIEVYQEYKKICKNARLTLIGKDVQKNISQMNISNELKKDILYVDYTDDTSKYIIESDLFLFPSIREGLPGVLIEAALTNIPVIASDINPNKEVARYFGNIHIERLNSDDWIKIILNLKENPVQYIESNRFNMESHVFQFIEMVER